MEFNQYHKIFRLNRDFTITEKIDGTNASILWSATERDEELALGEFDGRWLYAASRTRWITPDSDNHGFARWVRDHSEDLAALGPGRHFGEWFGAGINRGYGLADKRFALFDQKWADPWMRPECCTVVPVLETVNGYTLGYRALVQLENLRLNGSVMVPGFPHAEGIVMEHSQAAIRFKSLCHKDDIPKSAEKNFTNSSMSTDQLVNALELA
jgi:hypothetical protein